jgi:hypothetical protein
MWLAALALLALVACVYWPGLGGGFVFDDFPNIVDNVTLHVTWQSTWQQWLAAVFSSPASDLQRPLAMLSFAINHAATGLDPYWMKLTNVAIHLLNTCLVFGLVRAVLRTRTQATTAGPSHHCDRTALLITAAWALNPINLMAVLFVVQRMESLCHTFVFAGLWLYLAGRARFIRDGSGLPLILGGLLGGTVVGVLVKESAALLPLYAFALEWTLLRFSSNRAGTDRRLVALFVVVLLLPAIGALAWLGPKVLQAGGYAGRGFTLSERLLTESRVVVDYLHWTLLPNLRTLSLYHDDYVVSHGLLSPPSTVLSLLLVAALLAAMAWLRQRRPLMALGLAWFFGAQLLTGTILPLELVYEHRNYFASLGLCVVIGDLLLRFPRKKSARRIGGLVAIAILIFYAGITALRAREWQDPLRFATTEAAKHPGSPRATYDLARDYIILSGYRPASPFAPLANAALERAMIVPGSTTLPDAAAIFFAARTGTPIQRRWWDSLQGKLRRDPIGPQQTSSLASLVECDLRYRCALSPGDLESTFAAALAQGRNAEILNIEGNYTLNRLGDPDRALQLWKEAAALAPNVVQYQATLARMLIASGHTEQAVAIIGRIRTLGRLGQNEAVALELEQRVRAATTPSRPVD